MIYHIALPEDWQAAQASGVYTMSTRGRTLADEGFIHASDTAEQVEAVRQFVYDDLEELLLLTIDESAVPAKVVREAPPGEDQLFPHIYGPLPVSAVVEVNRLSR
jgi:glutathione S-transferase